MNICSGITLAGTRCTQCARPGMAFCHRHDPERSEERKRSASRAGKSKTSRIVKELHDLLEDLSDRVLAGEVETARGAVVNQIASTRIRLVELERRLREQQELSERLDALEEAVEQDLRRQETYANGKDRPRTWQG